MKEIILQTEYPCLVVTDKEEVFLSPTDKLTLTETEFYVYPIGERENYPFKVDLKEKSMKRYRICEEGNKAYCFLFYPQTLRKKIIEKQKIGQINLKIYIGSNELKYQTDEEELCLPINLLAREYVCQVIENFSCLLFKNNNNEELYLFNPETNYFKIYKGRDFKFENKKISFTHILSDIASSKFDKVLNFDKNEVKEEIVKTNLTQYHTNDNTICYAFLDCIVQENYFLAKKLLNDNFSETSEENFKDFFGNVYKFFPIETNRFLLIYKNENKIIKFTIEDNLISDFEI